MEKLKTLSLADESAFDYAREAPETARDRSVFVYGALMADECIEALLEVDQVARDFKASGHGQAVCTLLHAQGRSGGGRGPFSGGDRASRRAARDVAAGGAACDRRIHASFI